MSEDNVHFAFVPLMPDGKPAPTVMVEAELIEFLRIPQISSSKNLHNVIEHLKRYRNCQGFACATRHFIHWTQFSSGLRAKPPMAANFYGIGLMLGYNGSRINLSLSQHQKGGKSWLNSW